MSGRSQRGAGAQQLYQLDVNGKPVPVFPSGQGYQPFSAAPQSPPSNAAASAAQLGNLQASAAEICATLDTTMSMVDGLECKTPFESKTADILRLLVAQVKEVKMGQYQLSLTVQRQVNSANTLQQQCRGMYRDLEDVGRSAVKAEQYQRRSTVTLVGLPYSPQESASELTEKVAATLSLSGERVLPADLEICHRNGKPRQAAGKPPSIPSVTARLVKTVKKDSVLKQYRNWDVVAKKPRAVRVYQSLSKHYSDLRLDIMKFFNPAEDSVANFGVSSQHQLVKWVTYVSPSAGFAVKLRSEIYFRNVHTFNDFLREFHEACKVKE